ncbi:MAG: sigma-54 dependent transcriptional regulator [bacterium]
MEIFGSFNIPMKSGARKILIIDDEPDVHYSFKRLLEKEPLTILSAQSGEEGLRLLQKEKPDVAVMDIRMGGQNGLETLREIRRRDPKQIVIMMTAYGTSQTAIEAMKLGAFDYILKPFDIDQLKELLQRALAAAGAMREKVELAAGTNVEDARTCLVGKSAAMQAVYKLIGQVARTDATVLITGESGTGKELVARAIYSNSARSNNTYMAINCAAIPENLLESELFGHEKGAFTGAVAQRIGKFEQCSGGTLFFDEIGDMPVSLQTKLLRVLQDGEIFRVGGDKPIRTNVRILTATNRDLWQTVQKREFREDLYYRLNVVSLRLPSLRERAEDIPLLAAYFINKWRVHHKNSGAKKISLEAMALLKNYRWPGNVRELENGIQRAVVMAGSETIQPADLPPEIGKLSSSAPVAEAKGKDLPLAEAIHALFEHARKNSAFPILPTVEKELIARALEQTNGNHVQTAKLLGITRATLRKRVEKFGLLKRTKVDS